jgi:predicted ATPase
VGRGSELAHLGERLRAAWTGAGGIVLIGGPAGIGKTRLIAEALSRQTTTSSGSGGRVVGRGYCTEDPGAPPLWPWHQAVRTLSRSRTTAPVDADVAAATRFQMLTDATETVLRTCAKAPTTLVLEDLHWADAASLDLLRHVAAEASAAPLLILATHRDNLPPDAGRIMHDLTRYPGVSTLTLRALSRNDVGHYLLGLQPGAAAAQAARVHEATGGLPLLLAASTFDGRATDLPRIDARTVSSALAARLEPGHRRLIEIAALIGTDVDTGLTADVADESVQVVHAAVTAGRRAGLLTGDHFVHALIRDGVCQLIDPAQAADLHRRTAVVLQARIPTDPGAAAPAAQHWHRAGTDPAALRAAAECGVAAARTAGLGLAHADAAQHLTGALAALERLGAADAELATLLVELASAHYLAGHYGDALGACDRAGNLARAAGRPDLLVASALVVRWVTFPEAAEVVSRLCRAALAVPHQGDAVRARLLAQLATMDGEAGRTAAADRHSAEALELAESSGDAVAGLDAVRAREMTFVQAADTEERLRMGDLAVAHADAPGPAAGRGARARVATEISVRAGPARCGR